MIIKFANMVSFQRCGLEDGSGELFYESLDELYNTITVDEILLKNDWDKVNNILIDGFTLDESIEIYHLNLDI